MAGILLEAGSPSSITAPNDVPAPPTTAPSPATAIIVAAPPTTASGKDVQIQIQNFAFGDPVTVKVGTRVTWTNLDNAQHTVTADDKSFDSGVLAKGQSFSFTFTKAGSVSYYCAIHGGAGGQGMSSKIIVQP
jgi:plastocyanin